MGDCLVLISAALYAVSNVCQEYTVKNLSRVEFLGMLGLFGTIISTIQMWGSSCYHTRFSPFNSCPFVLMSFVFQGGSGEK